VVKVEAYLNWVIWSCDVNLQVVVVFLFYHSLITCLLLFPMPKKSWASEEQQTWLLAQLADFRLAREAKTTPNYLTDLYQKFHEVWPPVLKYRRNFKSRNEEKAKTVKQKASETVSGLYTSIINSLAPLFGKFLGAAYGGVVLAF